METLEPEGERWQEMKQQLAERLEEDEELTEEQLWKFLRTAYAEGYDRGQKEREKC